MSHGCGAKLIEIDGCVMALGQEVDGGCANRIWGQWQPWVGGDEQIGCVCAQKLTFSIKLMKSINVA